MGFLDYVFNERSSKRAAAALFVGFALFYGLMNMSYVSYIVEVAPNVQAFNPFSVSAFPLNLFNFDPSMYYGMNSSSIIHPLISYLTAALGGAAKALGGNWFFLALQSLINAASVVLVYVFLQRKTKELLIPLLAAMLFGFSSYLIFTAMIPDSYPYAQFVILLSVVYMQFFREKGNMPYVLPAMLGALNFGVTSTNIIPFAAGMFFNMSAWRSKKGLIKFISIMALAVGIIAALTIIQYVAFGGRSWVSNWLVGLQNGGTNYATPFQFAVHWQSLAQLTINPMYSPRIHLLDTGLMAFVTDLSVRNPLFVTLLGSIVLLLALAGFITGIRDRETWTLMPYILFAFLLHIVVGFGLAVYKYDMYLYAGHYLFAFVLLGGGFMIRLRKGLGKMLLTILLAASVFGMAGNNIYRHVETLSIIKQEYEQLITSGPRDH
ncbi:DUF6080 domain-containing protein [Paenibacillus sp. CAU 1782]